MGGLVSGLAVLGLMVGLTPLGLMAVFVVLGGKRPTANGIAFLAGWFSVLLGIVLAAALLLNGQVKPKTAPSTAMLWLTLVLGLGCLLVAVRIRRKAAKPHPESGTPAWLVKLESVGPGGSFIAGVTTPTYPAAIAAGTDLIRSDVGTSGRFVALGVFLVLSTALVAVPVSMQIARPESAQATIARWRIAVIARRQALLIWLLLLLGAYLAAKGAIQLASN